MSEFQFMEGALLFNGLPLLSELPDIVTLVDDPKGVGVFLHCAAEKAAPRHVFSLGRLQSGLRLVVAHRYEPFWMKAAVGAKGSDVPPETQFLLCERENGSVVLFAPILDGDFRACLQGSGEDGLELVAETGDPAVCGANVTGLFIAADTDPYRLMERGAQAVMARMQTGRLRRDKDLPAFADLFGWCTWDAFYQEVSHDKVRLGLESFARGGIRPRSLILDDGWQSTRKLPSGERRLIAFAANEQFPGDLAPTVQMAKTEFGIETFLVWHALHGYWGGVDGDALPGYEVRGVERQSSPGIRHHQPKVDEWWGNIVGVVSAQAIYRFYQDYHRHLRAQGVDGVKVDSQSTLESVAHGGGGRVPMMRHYHAALEGSAQTQFAGALINCMSCSSEMLYSALASNLTRTSTDFWPKRPESHGEHLYVNALVSLWFGEFVHPDWDMFQSGHAMGAYHAMARAIGGCPVYVSDKPGAHDFDVLRKLTLPDGMTLRASAPGRPTRDCLFRDPTREDALLKIFNLNDADNTCGVIGAFNARYTVPAEAQAAANGADMPDAEPPHAALAQTRQTIVGSISPADVIGLQGERFAVYRHTTDEYRVMTTGEKWQIELAELTGDIFTLAAIRNDFAPIGLVSMYNSGGAIRRRGMAEQIGTRRRVTAEIKGAGRLVAWSKTRPERLLLNGDEQAFSYSYATNLLEFALPPTDAALLSVEWQTEAKA